MTQARAAGRANNRRTYLWDTVALLAILSGANERASHHGNLKVQKLVFLAEIEGQSKGFKAAHYRFFRWNMGPYCAALANHMTNLEDATSADSSNPAINRHFKPSHF